MGVEVARPWTAGRFGARPLFDMPPVNAPSIPQSRARTSRFERAPVIGRRVGREDRQLVRSLQRQEQSATRELYERYGGVTLGMLTKMLHDRTAAEDVLQEVYLDVWRRGASFDPARGSLLNWILAIARNRAIDVLRKRSPEPVDPQGPAFATRADPVSDIDILLGEWRLAALLKRLRPEESQLLAMRFRDGLSQREIAEKTGIALGTVKLRMVQAMDRLRELIEREEVHA